MGYGMMYGMRPDGTFTWEDLDAELLARGLMRCDAYGEVFSLDSAGGFAILEKGGFPPQEMRLVKYRSERGEAGLFIARKG